MSSGTNKELGRTKVPRLGSLVVGLGAGALTLISALATGMDWSEWWSEVSPATVALALALNLLFGGLAVTWRALSLSGGLAGMALGSLVYLFLGIQGWFVLATFVVLGTALTNLGRGRKAARGLAEGQRRASQVLANGGVAAVVAVPAAVGVFQAPFLLAFAGALCAAAADTAGSEIGQLARGRPRLVTTWVSVSPGTDGAVSVVGSLAGLGAAALVAAVGVATGLLYGADALLVTAAGALGSLVDSLLGATVERRGSLGNDGVNFLATLVAAGCAGWSYYVF